MPLDVAFRVQSGRLDFAKNADGEFYLDELAVYSVFATLAAHKGEYAFDSGLGTHLHRIKKDGAVTGTRLKSCSTDAIEQCVAAGLIRSGEAQPERLRSGSWSIGLRWVTVNGGKEAGTVQA